MIVSESDAKELGDLEGLKLPDMDLIPAMYLEDRAKKGGAMLDEAIDERGQSIKSVTEGEFRGLR